MKQLTKVCARVLSEQEESQNLQRTKKGMKQIYY